MTESAYFNNGNFREYSYFVGEFCSLETGIHGDPDILILKFGKLHVWVQWREIQFLRS